MYRRNDILLLFLAAFRGIVPDLKDRPRAPAQSGFQESRGSHARSASGDWTGISDAALADTNIFNTETLHFV
ncbi:hypothetical protein EC957_003820 [Mortierella hygrophila]|uniref:Uncharacterized protein n=1 Tax=Mortierella hygrophila TaxID=979708 RepID=A0A9P6FFI4_9FUNG|nr:hypothetical protein EC957_003820 [Mortierella hygrophila]